MPDVVRVAKAVAGRLSDYQAEVSFFPEYSLSDLEEMKVCVVPLAAEYKPVGRNTKEVILKVQVGFLKRADEEDLEELLRQVESIGLGFLNVKLAGAVCIGVAYNPIYSAEHLRERRQFTSVMELSFKVFQ